MWNNTLYGITTWSVVFALDARTGKELWRWDPEVNPLHASGDLLRQRESWYRALQRHDHRALHRRPVVRAERADGQAGVGNAHRLSARPVHTDHGAAYRERESDHRRGRRRPANARPVRRTSMRRRASSCGASTRCLAIRRSRMRAKRCAARRKPGAATSTRMAAVAPCGMDSLTIPRPIWFTSARATRAVGAEIPGPQGLDNLYTCSILAVDLTTGQLKWHYQAVPNDNWDFDNVQQLMLLDLNINGRTRKVITQAAKNGFFYVLDRVTGEFISAEPFVKVSWALGMGKDGRPVVNPAAYYDQEPISIYPTGGGAHNWSPMSYNPNTGLVYIPSSYRAFPIRRGNVQAGLHGLRSSTGSDEDYRADHGARASERRARRTAGVGSGETETAVEPRRRRRHRRRHDDHRWQSGLSGDQRRPLPRDQRRQGRGLIRSEDEPHGMAPPITYEVDGKQYVAFGGGLGRAEVSSARTMRRWTTRR